MKQVATSRIEMCVNQ